MVNLIVSLLFAVLPPCEYEDSPNCAWDASESGNGVGHSFVNVDGQVFYLD